MKPKGSFWLMHCATNRKFAGSIPDGVTGIFQWLNPSGRMVALRSNQPLTEILPGGKDGRCVRLTTLPPSSADCLEILEPQPPETPRACPGLSRPVAGKLYQRLVSILQEPASGPMFSQVIQFATLRLSHEVIAVHAMKGKERAHWHSSTYS
jgi:hypothetical protein